MAERRIDDPRLDRISKLCLGLPEVTREAYGKHAWFVVRKKKFVYYLDDHHGDGIVAVCIKTEPGQNAVLIDSDPTRFYSPAYMGHRGWVGLRLDLGEIDWDEVVDFVTESYRLTAPKKLGLLVPRCGHDDSSQP